jgi:hypothetical protein
MYCVFVAPTCLPAAYSYRYIFGNALRRNRVAIEAPRCILLAARETKMESQLKYTI